MARGAEIGSPRYIIGQPNGALNIGPYKKGPIGPYAAQTKITPMPGGLGRPSQVFICFQISWNFVKQSWTFFDWDLLVCVFTTYREALRALFSGIGGLAYR